MHRRWRPHRGQVCGRRSGDRVGRGAVRGVRHGASDADWAGAAEKVKCSSSESIEHAMSRWFSPSAAMMRPLAWEKCAPVSRRSRRPADCLGAGPKMLELSQEWAEIGLLPTPLNITTINRVDHLRPGQARQDPDGTRVGFSAGQSGVWGYTSDANRGSTWLRRAALHYCRLARWTNRSHCLDAARSRPTHYFHEEGQWTWSQNALAAPGVIQTMRRNSPTSGSPARIYTTARNLCDAADPPARRRRRRRRWESRTKCWPSFGPPDGAGRHVWMQPSRNM